jgi:glutathione peroxidase
MRMSMVRKILLAAMLSSSALAMAQRDPIEKQAPDPSAPKSDAPAPGGRKGQGGKAKPGGGAADKPGDADAPGNGYAAASEGTPVGGGGGRGRGGRGGGPPGAAGDDNKTVYDFGLPAVDGKNLPLADFKGKVLLIVNLGRESSYADQLAGLQKLNDTYKDKGLVVIGVPSDEFGAAEPGKEEEIAKYYADAKVTFPITQLSTLTGVHQLPLYDYLVKNKAITVNGLHWNYTKYLIDRKGKPIVRFGPDVAPDSLEMKANILEALDGTWKPKKPDEGGSGRRGGGGGDAAEPPPM